MAGPWEKYGAAETPSGPWQKYGAAPPTTSTGVGDAIANFAKNFWGEMTQTGQGMVDMFSRNPLDTLKGIGASQDAIRLKAQDAMKRGDYTEAARHAINYLIPLVGPGLDVRGDQAQRGDISGALGGTTAIGAQMFGPNALESAITAAPRVASAVGTAADATKAAVKAGVKDVAVGGVKTATGVALAKAGPLGEIADVIAGIPLVKSGLKQAGRGVRAGYSEGTAALTPPPVEPPLGGMGILSPDYFDRLRLPPGSAITPAPPVPPDASFVRSVPAMYPTGPTPLRALPAPANVIVPEAPPDTSFVRSVPAEYPDIIPPHLRANAPAANAAISLRDLMRESGTLPPETPTPIAPEAPAVEPSNPFEAYARIAKAERLAKAAKESGLTARDAHDMIADEAARNAFAQGMREESVSPQTMALIENELKKLAPKKRKAQ
jgi:hypothetical protein